MDKEQAINLAKRYKEMVAEKSIKGPLSVRTVKEIIEQTAI